MKNPHCPSCKTKIKIPDSFYKKFERGEEKPKDDEEGPKAEEDDVKTGSRHGGD